MAWGENDQVVGSDWGSNDQVIATVDPSGNVPPTPVPAGNWGSNDEVVGASTVAKTTGYYPVSSDSPNYKMEGGNVDRKGNPLHTLDAFQRGEVKDFVTIAGDPRIPYGTPAPSPQFPGIPFEVRDTGSAFNGAGLSHFDIARDNADGANSDENNQPAQFNVGLAPEDVPGQVSNPQQEEIRASTLSDRPAQLLNWVGRMTDAAFAPGQASAALVSPETAAAWVNQGAGGVQNVAAALQKITGKPFAEAEKAVEQEMANAASSFTQPESGASLLAFAAPGVAEAYAVGVLAKLPEQFGRLKDAISKHGLISAETAQAATQAGIQDLTAFLATKGALKAREAAKLAKKPFGQAVKQPTDQTNAILQKPPLTYQPFADLPSDVAKPATAPEPAPAGAVAEVLRTGDIGPETDTFSKPGHIYRGMEQTEFDDTVAKGKGIKSRGDYSHPSEGTNFASDFSTAESYVNFGRSDPRKTGKPNYIVEAPVGELKPNRQGYIESFQFVQPTRIWKVEAQGKNLIVSEIRSTARPEVSTTAAAPNTTGVANRVLAADAAAGMIDEIASGKGMSWEEMVALGREKLNQGADPQEVARRFGRTKRISPTDFAVLRAERERLAVASNQAAEAVRANPGNPQAQAALVAARAADTAWVRDVVQPAKTATSDIFRGMQGEAPIDATTFEGLRRAVLDTKHREPTPKEAQLLERQAAKVKQTTLSASVDRVKLQGKMDGEFGKGGVPTLDQLRAEIAQMAKELTPCK